MDKTQVNLTYGVFPIKSNSDEFKLTVNTYMI